MSHWKMIDSINEDSVQLWRCWIIQYNTKIYKIALLRNAYKKQWRPNSIGHIQALANAIQK